MAVYLLFPTHFGLFSSSQEPASLRIPQGSGNGETKKSQLSAPYSSCNISDPFLELVREIGYIPLNSNCGCARIT